MDKDEVRKQLLNELTALQKEFNIPQAEIDRAILQFEDLIPLLQDKDDLLQQLADDLIDSLKYRANIGIPDTIPDDMILENIAQEETTNKTLQTDSKSTDPLGKQLSAKTAVFSEGEYAGRSIEDVWQNTVKNKRTPGTPGKSGVPDGSGLIQPGNMQDSYDAYDDLWKQWFTQNPNIYEQAVAKRKEGYKFVDTFGREGNVRQDETIMRIIDSEWKPGGQSDSVKFPLKKIISGMQKNVDQYGIEAAKILGLDYGGTVNQGFKVVPEGSNSPNFQEFVDSGKWEEIESQYYPDRTKANAQNADGTVWFGEGDSRGYGATKNYSGDKPWIENPTDVELRQWIIDNNIQTLNVAGNRSYGTEELGQQAMNTIIKAVDPTKLPPQGGSLGAAKANDPNIFPEALDEKYDETVHADFKRNILDQMNYEDKKLLSFFNDHPVVKDAQLNGESVLLGLYKYFGPKFMEKYDNIKNINLGTKVALGTTKFAAKRTLGVGKFLLNTLRLLDPVGEGLELASKIATRAGIAKAGGLIAKQGTKVASNLKYELYNQIVWQTSAAVIAGVENGAMAFNSVLDKYGLFPQALKDAGVEVVPYQDVMKEAANNYRYWQSKYWQASKTTSLFYLLDTAIPSVFTGQSIPTRFQKGLTGAMLPPVFNEKTLGDTKLSAEDREFWNIVSGWDVTDIRAKQDKWYHILPGFSLNSGWLQNEMEQTGTLFQPSYYSQQENPDLSKFQQDSHVSVYNRLEKLINRYGKDIEPIAKDAIDYYDTVLKGENE